ncbi:class I SAM-dependent methyltransferase [Shewanella sp. Scap07]|uniref:class I SAM-dependent methyltransferase n=1 Tax=Shewanella sp. Scap07 TaxID=2589987 RepID=UPI0015BCBC7D|nr:class I SAM-dependent methyltransferase [Shewanella sp. Scap07]QLE85418.1 class I SAM-dependent methyltransferase [Shewanella sp. Scap07]
MNTIDYYNQNARSFITDTESVDMSALYHEFISLLPKGASVLDAGCGSGRDTKYFVEQGYEVSALDASLEMVQHATKLSGVQVSHRTFSQVNEVEAYDGIWACASLLHVAKDSLEEAFSNLSNALKPKGVWYLSFKYGDKERSKGGRHFTDLNEALLQELVDKVGQLKVLKTWVTVDARPDREEKWLNAILIKASVV